MNNDTKLQFIIDNIENYLSIYGVITFDDYDNILVEAEKKFNKEKYEK